MSKPTESVDHRSAPARTSPFLRKALLADAAATGATGASMALGAGLLQEGLVIPAELLQYAGVSLLPFAVFLAWLALRERVLRPAVRAVIVCNGLWAAGSILLVLSARIEPNLLGQAFIVGQALVVAVFAELEYVGLRRSDDAPLAWRTPQSSGR